ncbi:hypothetical protein [Streptomyces sp. NBC_00454]|uniref:hypothetical protein n=1 Tax=Streptomyces sp. NBC_00454 TaxID=2975747 RepID=UPI0030E2C8E5
MPQTVDRWTTTLRSAWQRGALWPWCLAAIAAFCAYAVTVVFHPGYLSVDSLEQLGQALGDQPVNDWHPPVMALLWRILIHTTGAVSAMAALQAVVLWGTLWVLARLVWKNTGSRWLSLAMLAVGLAPHVMNFTGVVWKDVHMAYALLAAFAVVLTARELPAGRTRTRWALLILGVLFLAYALLVRKNGFVAVIPVFIMLVLAIWPSSGRRRWLIATSALVAVTAVASAAVSSTTHPVATRQYAQIPLDDIVHVLTPAQVGAAADKAGASADFRNRLVAAATTCQSERIPADAYFQCYPRNKSLGVKELRGNTDVLLRMWTQEMPKHLRGYTVYRVRVFSKLLFQGNQAFQNGSDIDPHAPQPPALASAPVNETLKESLQGYVTGFARDLPMIFQGWFWLVVGLVLTLRRWSSRYARELRLLGASSVLYVLAYLPTAPQSNFRYVYWPALAGTVAVLLLLAEYVARRRATASGGAPVDVDPGDHAGGGSGATPGDVRPVATSGA